MMMGSTLRNCDVIKCEEPAPGVYLCESEGRMMAFVLCPGHFARLENGEHPVVVSEPVAVGGLDSRPALIMESE
jgi:hypothetical protein